MPQLGSQLGAAAIATGARIRSTPGAKNHCVRSIGAVNGFYTSNMTVLRKYFQYLAVAHELAARLRENIHQRVDNILGLIAHRKDSIAPLHLRGEAITLQHIYYIIISELM